LILLNQYPLHLTKSKLKNMTASVVYKGDLRCECTHLQSGTVIETDAPTDNRGKGQRFSPTDSLCVALATCIITTMGIKANDMDINLAGTAIDVTKHMLSDPRRIGTIDIILKFPATLQLNEKDKTILKRVGDNCPVAKSLHPDLNVNIEYHWA
jgi:putative redox protein